MFGLEEKEKKPRFEFDLEKQIKSNPQYGKELVDKTEKNIQEIKKLLREGSHEKEFDHLAVLLDGYTALQRVLKKIAK